MLGIFAFVLVYALVTGVWLRSSFNSDGLGPCLARSGGADCGAAIRSFTRQFTGGALMPLTLVTLLIPGFLGAVVGAPVLGAELERATWQLAWSQSVPRSRWLAVKLGLIITGVIVFGVLQAVIMTWTLRPLDEVSIRLTPPQFNLEGVWLPCALLCGFGLALLAGLLFRNTLGAMVAGYFATEIPFLVTTLAVGPSFFSITKTVGCAGALCQTASTNTIPPVSGHLGDLVNSVTHAGDHLVVSYTPATAFWPMQFAAGGIYLAIALAAIVTAVWLLHRRTT